MQRSRLEALLGQVPPPADPDPTLEQVRTPPGIAARFLMEAHDAAAVQGRRVLDLGCGTGILAWGAAALGASEVLGLDVSAADLEVARRLVLPGIAAPSFVEADVQGWVPEAPFDTVVMNPPFGAQRANRHADRPFYATAVRATRPHGQVWFLAQTRTEGYLSAMARQHGAEVERREAWEYPLEAFYAFHRQEARRLEVGAYRLTWPSPPQGP